jgi:hypothetical protein
MAEDFNFTTGLPYDYDPDGQDQDQDHVKEQQDAQRQANGASASVGRMDPARLLQHVQMAYDRLDVLTPATFSRLGLGDMVAWKVSTRTSTGSSSASVVRVRVRVRMRMRMPENVGCYIPLNAEC